MSLGLILRVLRNTCCFFVIAGNCSVGMFFYRKVSLLGKPMCSIYDTIQILDQAFYEYEQAVQTKSILMRLLFCVEFETYHC